MRDKMKKQRLVMGNKEVLIMSNKNLEISILYHNDENTKVKKCARLSFTIGQKILRLIKDKITHIVDMEEEE